MLEGLAVWALFIYLLRLVGMPWNKFTQGFRLPRGRVLANVCLGWTDQFHSYGLIRRFGGSITSYSASS